MPGVAEGKTPDGDAVRVQALKSAKGVNFLCHVFFVFFSFVLHGRIVRSCGAQ